MAGSDSGGWGGEGGRQCERGPFPGMCEQQEALPLPSAVATTMLAKLCGMVYPVNGTQASIHAEQAASV